MSPSHRHDSFYALGVRPVLAEALAARGIVEPFPIQAAALPDALAGRDVLGRGRTGSGKTVAFALPLLERVLTAPEPRRPGRPRALVLVPTRELSVQVAETVEYLAHAVGLRTMTVFGGVRYTGQLRRLERGVDVVVATPGRLEDLVEQGHLKLDAVGVVVLDEADLMADMGFLPSVTRVLESVPAGQRMLFSATLDGEVQTLVDRFLRSPSEHSVDAEASGTDAEHYLFLVTQENKASIVKELVSGGGRTLAFTRTKAGAERLAETLRTAGVSAVDLHGNLRQAARQRNLSAFAEGSVSVLVATDIAARGIHVDDIGLVLHVDPPNDPKAFLHRSGRTARAGSEGNVVTLATKGQNKAVRSLLGLAHIKHKQVVVAPGDPVIAEVRAPLVERVVAGPSIFTPDPEDSIADPDDRPTRSPERAGRTRSWGRPEKPARTRAWGRPEKPAPTRAWGRPERPTHEPREHGRGARPDWSDTRPRPVRRPDDRLQADPNRGDRRRGEQPVFERPRDDRRRDDRPRDDRPRDDRPRDDRPRDDRPARGGRRQGEWTAEWWGPEPWEVDERADRKPDRGQRRPDARGDRRPDSRPERREARPANRPDAAGAAPQPRAKNRWTPEDRRKASESSARGFGYTKAAKPGKPSKASKAGAPSKAKGRPASNPDKGKPKRKLR